MKIVEFTPNLLDGFVPHEHHTEVIGIVGPDYARDLASAGPAYAAIDGSTVVACAGCALIWRGRYVAWALLSKESGRHMAAITRAVKRGMEMLDGRIETIVNTEFEAGHRWVKLLGFEYHHHEERFLPNGGDADIYVRFQ